MPEAMVYKLVFKVSNQVAEEFQDSLVITAIRQHDAFMTEQKPKVDYVDNLVDSEDL